MRTSSSSTQLNMDILNTSYHSDLLITNVEEIKALIEDMQYLFTEYDFNFNTPDNKDIEDLEQIIVDQDTNKVLSFKDFKKLVKHDFYNNSDTYGINDFDWDDLEEKYNEFTDLYHSFETLIENITDNLTGNQTIETIEVHTQQEAKDIVFSQAEETNLVYQIPDKDGDTLYIINHHFLQSQ